MGYSVEEKIPKDRLAEFCKRNHIRRLSVFGSALRGQLGPDRDIDLLVEFQQGHVPGLFSIVRMELEFTEMLGRKADLRIPEDLSEYFRDEVVEKAEVQYQA